MVDEIAANQGDPNNESDTLTEHEKEAYDDEVRKLIASAKAEDNLAGERERLHAAKSPKRQKKPRRNIRLATCTRTIPQPNERTSGVYQAYLRTKAETDACLSEV